ncbi:Neurotransmitter-gated ion-channel ligand binding domain protein [Onchocerca flexuosa]|uniref:Neurotransmitter-gated ion-channel ligand binding domain protein n=1 Tax=Onchocerca flexuosa TaxID=387005 RepID=A0A238C568_9BILA|nr:Neurotransmitter-gated ion-channel ligand binding domain protein [Onchocerca flexuosa]
MLPEKYTICAYFLHLTATLLASNYIPTQLKLVHDMVETYDKKSKPVWDHTKPINVTFSMDLYQILEVNEPQQYILLSAWIIERWYDEFLYWRPEDYDNITEIHLPHSSIWLPDTTLYNSLVMKDDDTRRLMNAKITTDVNIRAAYIELLYPTVYKFSCLLNLRFFPFDIQGSILYNMEKKEMKYDCCPNKYTLLSITLYLRRKPLFYIINLIIPTSITTLIAIVGFFTTSTASGMREEKVSLGITTLLSMSILMLMISDQMPTTSTFIPLIGWFILAMITIITFGTLASSVIIALQKRGRLKSRLTPRTVCLMKFIAYIIFEEIPKHLMEETHEEDLKTMVLRNERCDLLKTRQSKGRWNKQWKFLQKRKRTKVVESHLSKSPKLSLNIHDFLFPKHCQSDQSVNISETQDIALSTVISPVPPTIIQHDSSERDNPGLKVNGNDGDSVLTSSKKFSFALAQQQRLPQKILTSSDENSIRQNRRLARDEYNWMAKVLERPTETSFNVMSLFLFAVIIAFPVTSLETRQAVSEMGKDDEMHYFISARQQLPHVRLIHDLLSTKKYDPSIRPVKNNSESLTLHISMSLYQIIDVDERSQYLTLNIWMVQALNFTFSLLWIYKSSQFFFAIHFAYKFKNYELSVVMNREGSEKYMNIVVKSRYWKNENGAEVFFLYPALYTVRCLIDIYYFPYDHQNCTLTLGSWTSSLALLNYTVDKTVNMQSYIPNEEWEVLSFNLHRNEVNSLFNLITALLAVSILMLMVSDQIPTTSDFVPLIAWFYLSNIIVISTATFCTCAVFRIHNRHKYGNLPPILVRKLFFNYICNYLCISPPHELMMLWNRSKENVPQELKQKKKYVSCSVQSLDKKKPTQPTQTTPTELSMKASMQRILENDTAEKVQRRAPTSSAKENWARLSFRLKDISSKIRDQSEIMPKESSLKQEVSTVHSDQKHTSLWNTAVQFAHFTSVDLSQKPESVELKSMKHRRQCTLEWEFLATIVDHVFLLLFSTITILIVTALAMIAKLAQRRFDGAVEMPQS